MTVSESAELNEIIARTFEGEFGNRATHRELYQSVCEATPQHIKDYVAHEGLRRRVTGFLNHRTPSGLPYAPVANASGEHVQLELMDFKDLEYLATQYIRKADPLVAQARKVAEVAFERYGKTIVVDGESLIGPERASA